MSDPGSTTTTDTAARLARATSAMEAQGVDALLVSPGSDLRYLTGYEAKPLERLTCLVLRAGADPLLVVPALEVAAARAGTPDLDLEILTWGETDDPYALVAAQLPTDVGTVALDNHMWAEKVLALGAALPSARQVLGGSVLAGLRMRKSAAEVEELRRAGRAIDRVHAQVEQWLRPGRTEREVGRDVAEAILAEGHASVDFTIVGSGPNGASPHHELSDRVIEAGESVVVDIGGTTHAGYCSDSTRTYLLADRVPPEVAEYYDVLLAAQRAQCAYARPGVSAESVDRVGRALITDAGFGAEFLHRTGHGIGVETHEEPYIVEGNEIVLEPGMAFSIEPGIYLEGRHGARIEDIVVCTEDGLERLNTRPRELALLG